jgi:hypothetical protein
VNSIPLFPIYINYASVGKEHKLSEELNVGDHVLVIEHTSEMVYTVCTTQSIAVAIDWPPRQ